MSHLFIFDLDGTLINITDQQVAATNLDYRTALGITLEDNVVLDKFGMGEWETHEAIFNELNLPYQGEERNRRIQQIIDQHPKSFREVLDPIPYISPLEEVVDFLSYLRKNNENLALATGNMQEPAEILLEKSGLKSFFQIVSYSDGIKSKRETIEYAIRQATDKNLQFRRVVFFDDTSKGVSAGRYVGALVPTLVVGVATGLKGSDSAESLVKAGADIVISSFRYYRKIYANII